MLIKNLSLSVAIAAALELMPITPGNAQTFTNLHSFAALDFALENHDGAYPAAGLVPSASALYGTASQGGNAGNGIVYKINANGTGFVALYNFAPSDPSTGFNSDGAFPLGGLVLDGATLYGTTSGGGSAGNGTVFRVNVDGSGFVVLHPFSASAASTGTNADGASPWASLILANGTLYGTATRGGDADSGTVFKLSTNGTGFRRLHSFSGLQANTQVNSDGASPLGGLGIAGNTLYGTTYRGGSLAAGTIYKVNIDGSGFTNLLNSAGGPRAALVLSGNLLYGTTDSGGSLGGGTVFQLNVDGTGFTNLQNFANGTANGPWAPVLLSNNTLYGTTYGGGDLGQGSIFKLNTDGTGFENIYSFSNGPDGAKPQANLALSASTLYGTASVGGGAGNGTVFGLALNQTSSQQLTITLSGNSVVLSWPVNATGLTLQSTPTFASPIVWTPVSPAPTVVNGENTVTNALTSTQRFYRLGQ